MAPELRRNAEQSSTRGTVKRLRIQRSDVGCNCLGRNSTQKFPRSQNFSLAEEGRISNSRSAEDLRKLRNPGLRRAATGKNCAYRRSEWSGGVRRRGIYQTPRSRLSLEEKSPAASGSGIVVTSGAGGRYRLGEGFIEVTMSLSCYENDWP
jgi:hypothetical protein